MAVEEPGTGSTDICELLQPAQGPGVTGTLPAEFEEEVELAINNWVSPRARQLFINYSYKKVSPRARRLFINYSYKKYGGGGSIVSFLALLIISVSSKSQSCEEVCIKQV